MKGLIIVLVILISQKASSLEETIICHGREETYNCTTYSGSDGPLVFDYTSGNYLEGVINVSEFSDSGTGYNDSSSDGEGSSIDGDDDEFEVLSTPPVIQYVPIPVYLYK